MKEYYVLTDSEKAILRYFCHLHLFGGPTGRKIKAHFEKYPRKTREHIVALVEKHPNLIYMNRSTIAKHVYCYPTTVSKAVSSLKERGLLTVFPIYRGPNRKNLYQVNLTPEQMEWVKSQPIPKSTWRKKNRTEDASMVEHLISTSKKGKGRDGGS